MADYGDGGLGGLGGFASGLNSFITNPLTLMSLKMMANNAPRVGQPVNTLEGVDDTLMKAGALRKKQMDEAAAKQAMVAALVSTGMDPASAKQYANNPDAGKIVLDQQKLKKQEEWGRDGVDSGVPQTPRAPRVTQVDQPEETQTAAAAPPPTSSTFGLPKPAQPSPGGTAVNAMDFGAPAPQPSQAPVQTAPAQEAPAQPAPKLNWLNLPASVQRGLGIEPEQQAPAQRPEPEPLPAEKVAAPPPQPPTTTQRAVDKYAQNERANVQAAPLQSSQPSAPPQPQQTATDRALLQRETANVQNIGERIQVINSKLKSPYATQHGSEALKKELDHLYKEYESTPLIKEYNRVVAQRSAQGQSFLSLEDYQKGLKSPLVSIDQKQESAYNQKMGTQLAEQNMEIVKDAQKARTKIATLDQLDSLLKAPGQYQGPGGKHVAKIAAWGKVFGIDVSNADASQAIESISNQFALELRSPTNGAGMPGALSDPDRVFLTTMPPGLEKLPGGNELIIDYMKRKEQRSVDVEKLRQKYVKQHGKLDEGFYSELSDWSDAHPLFTEKDQETVNKIASTAPVSKSAFEPERAAPVKVTSPAQARKLPSGTRIILPDGSPGVVP